MRSEYRKRHNPKLDGAEMWCCPNHNHAAMVGPPLAPAQEPTTMATSPAASRTAANPLLHILKDTLAASVASDGPDFTARQLTVFLKVYLEPGTEHTVRGLAADLNVSKPAITRALDRLAEFDFTKREKDPKDARSVIVRRTPKGSAYLGTLSGYLNAASKQAAKPTKK
jgi:DNA-binding MarR family transcriptional regulator